ncbi:hypothetical protein GCM10022224_047950 [Nonomuraea antimicrobica]|uniref:Uncharacterized protein n=1 Tax=Nonomuraea antimicrobica TaxID=561173 RepID=A0ABP7C7P2_9ACTN
MISRSQAGPGPPEAVRLSGVSRGGRRREAVRGSGRLRGGREPEALCSGGGSCDGAKGAVSGRWVLRWGQRCCARAVGPAMGPEPLCPGGGSCDGRELEVVLVSSRFVDRQVLEGSG